MKKSLIPFVFLTLMSCREIENPVSPQPVPQPGECLSASPDSSLAVQTNSLSSCMPSYEKIGPYNKFLKGFYIQNQSQDSRGWVTATTNYIVRSNWSEELTPEDPAAVEISYSKYNPNSKKYESCLGTAVLSGSEKKWISDEVAQLTMCKSPKGYESVCATFQPAFEFMTAEGVDTFNRRTECPGEIFFCDHRFLDNVARTLFEKSWGSEVCSP